MNRPARRIIVTKQFLLSLVIAILILSMLPYLLRGYLLQFTIILLVFLALAESFDVLYGFTGYVNLGHVVPFGISAYVFAILFRQGFHPPFATSLAILASLIYAFAISYPIFRLKGPYFAIGTLALTQFAWLLTLNLREVTGGADGLAIPAGDVSLPAYYILAASFTVIVLFHYFLGRSKLGLALRAILNDEVAAEHSGINISSLKRKIFIISSLFAALIGPIYVWNINYVEPSMCFGYTICFFPTVASLLGGPGRFYGPIMGGIILLAIQEILWTRGILYSLLLYGLVLIFVGLLIPRGLAEVFWSRVKFKSLSRERNLIERRMRKRGCNYAARSKN